MKLKNVVNEGWVFYPPSDIKKLVDDYGSKARQLRDYVENVLGGDWENGTYAIDIHIKVRNKNNPSEPTKTFDIT